MERININKFRIYGDEPRGYSDKYWVIDDKKKLVKYNGATCPDQDVMEHISYTILTHLGIKCVKVGLGYNSEEEALKQMNLDDPRCCIIDSFLEEPADVTINLLNNTWVKPNINDEQKNISSCFYKVFNIFNNLAGIKEDDFNQMKKDYIRMVFGDCILDNEDRRLKNIESIFNEKTGSYHLAPSFDNGLAFNAFNIGDTEGYCYIGNQEFPVSSLIEYIITHYKNEVADIIENLDTLANTQIEEIIKNYQEEIPQEKLLYIYNYITNVNELVKATLTKTNAKTK